MAVIVFAVADLGRLDARSPIARGAASPGALGAAVGRTGLRGTEHAGEDVVERAVAVVVLSVADLRWQLAVTPPAGGVAGA